MNESSAVFSYVSEGKKKVTGEGGTRGARISERESSAELGLESSRSEA